MAIGAARGGSAVGPRARPCPILPTVLRGQRRQLDVWPTGTGTSTGKCTPARMLTSIKIVRPSRRCCSPLLFLVTQFGPQSGDASWFEARVDAAQCTQYLCPRTLSCVSKPSHCPCPFPQQIRCSYKDTDSAAKDHAQRAGGTFDGVDAALDLGGTFCVTADSCDEVNRILHAKV